MEKEKCKVEIEQYVETKEAIKYLEDLVKGLKSGTIVIQHGEESVTLTPPDMVELELEAKQKKDKSKFVLELSWKSMPAMAEAPMDKPVEKKPEAAAKPVDKPAEKPVEKHADKPADKGPRK